MSRMGVVEQAEFTVSKYDEDIAEGVALIVIIGMIFISISLFLGTSTHRYDETHSNVTSTGTTINDMESE